MSRQYKPKAGFWIRFCVVLLFPFDALLYRIRWHHLERMTPPSAGGVIIAINHVSHIVSPCSDSAEAAARHCSAASRWALAD